MHPIFAARHTALDSGEEMALAKPAVAPRGGLTA
jgi:hypothetical protein